MQVKRSLGLFLLLSFAVICASPSAKADTISVFTISGTGYNNCLDNFGEPIPGCTSTTSGFAGALEVDATTGTPIEMAGLGPGIGFFGSSLSGVFPGLGVIGATPNGSCLEQGESLIAEYLILCFTTPTPGSLVGFDGGAIIGLPTAHSGKFDNSNYQYFFITGGSITPVTTPEPSSLSLILRGLVGLALVTRLEPRWARRSSSGT